MQGVFKTMLNFLSHQPSVFIQDTAKCDFMLSLLTLRALEWTMAVWDKDEQICQSFTYFLQQTKEVFEYSSRGRDISVQLLSSRQGNLCAANYAVQFRTVQSAEWMERHRTKASVLCGTTSSTAQPCSCYHKPLSASTTSLVTSHPELGVWGGTPAPTKWRAMLLLWPTGTSCSHLHKQNQPWSDLLKVWASSLLCL